MPVNQSKVTELEISGYKVRSLRFGPSELEAITRKILTGKKSTAVIASEMADEFNITITKNTIIGLAHRNNLPLMSSTWARKINDGTNTKEGKERAEAIRRVKQAQAKREYAQRRNGYRNPVSSITGSMMAPAPREARKPLTEFATREYLLKGAKYKYGISLTDERFAMSWMCRFPVRSEKGQGGWNQHFYCGEPQDEGCSYCRAHRRVMRSQKGAA